ncbi:MAG: membrane protein insertion efficiency factor YidD [Phycisphaerales bacterium]
MTHESSKSSSQHTPHQKLPLISRAVAFPLIVLVKIYQFTLSPIMGRQCRYHPTCSWYALEALRTHGGFTGALLAAKRIARCHPFAKGGNDPVPHKE